MRLRAAATQRDIKAIVILDPIARQRASRTEFITTSVHSGDCLVAIEANEIIAYAVLDYTFFGNGYISMLYVHPNHRCHGVGSELMKSLEARCTTDKLFTSTNRSNAPMQALLPRLGFSPSGIIDNLDEGDPELVYFKRIRSQAA